MHRPKNPLRTCSADSLMKSSFLCVGLDIKHYGDYSIRLSVFRAYPNVKNEFGGLGRHVHLPDSGKSFPTESDAWDYAYERGYTQQFFTRTYCPTHKTVHNTFHCPYQS